MTLAGVAATIGFLHTLFGPDHYIPFIVMSQARGWSRTKTAWITFLCGLGHVGSSVVLGLIGVAIGVAVGELVSIERACVEISLPTSSSHLGSPTSSGACARAIRNKPHTHIHLHPGEGDHAHGHSHIGVHSHVHDVKAKANITPWVLFTIFVFGPCEPLIPILMYPAATKSYWGLAIVTAIFAAVTITTMLTVVLLGSIGISFIPLKKIERYTHALAGATIALCGVLIILGL